MSTVTNPRPMWPGPGERVPTRRPDLPRALSAAAVSVCCLVGAVVVYVVFVRHSTGQRYDEYALEHLGRSERTRELVSGVLSTVSISALGATLLACVAVAAMRRRWAEMVGAVVVFAGSIGTTELLKHRLLTRPDLGYGVHLNSLPSGHTTVIAALVLASLLVVPVRFRALVTLAGSVALTVTGVGTVVAGWHRPSDVVAALLVTLCWASGVLAVLSLVPGPEPSRPRHSPALAAVAGLPLAAAFFLTLGVRPDGSTTDLVVHAVIMGGLALLGGVVVAGFARMVDVRLP